VPADTTPPTPDDLRTQVRELCAHWRRDGRYTPRSDSWLRSPDRAFSKELAARGLLGMTWPAPYGRGLGQLHRLAVTEELLRAGAPVALHWIADRQIGPAILRHGSDELKQELLPAIAAADAVFCLGLSEPEAGSDLAAVRTRAEPDGAGGYVLTGRKIWTSGAHLATHVYVLARTHPRAEGERPHAGLSEFVVDMTSEGIEISPIVDMTGEHHFNEVSFDAVRVPGRRLLGTPGQGWRQVTEQLAFERGGPERVLTTYPLFAQVLAHAAGIPGVRAEIGRLTARLAVLRALCRDVAEALGSGRSPVREAATCKLLGNEFERDVLELARKVAPYGPAGFRRDLAEALAASPAFSLRGGAAEVLLSMVAKAEVAA